MEDKETIQAMLLKRGMAFDLNPLFELDSRRKSLQKEHDDLRAKQNEVSKEVQALKKSGKDASAIIADMQKAKPMDLKV